VGKFEQFRQRQQADDPTWGRIIHFESLDPSNPVGAETLSFAQQPEKFDYKTYTELHVNAWALALGVDVQELWQLTGGNIGSGQQSQVLHAKSQGKTFGDLLTKLERALNTYVLPDSLEFTFKRHDPYEAQERAETAQLWAGVAAAVQNNMTPEEKRVMLANMVEAIKDAITDENGEIVRLPDQDVKPPDEDQTVDDANPQQPDEAGPEATQDDAKKAVKSITATRLDFEADWGDLVEARRKGDVNSVRFDIVARAQLAKYIPRAFEDGLIEVGIEDAEMDSDDKAEALALVAKASGYVTDLNTALDNMGEAEAALKPGLWWNKSISPAYDAGRLSADKNGLYEFVGDDGEESCTTCQRLKGQVHRMRDWTRKQLRPGADTKSFACGGWRCKHRLVKTTGRAMGSY
jgi:hypothetical protein